jgi:hypothetical protein
MAALTTNSSPLGGLLKFGNLRRKSRHAEFSAKIAQMSWTFQKHF